ERGRRGQRLALELARGRREERIVPQGVVVVEIFVAQGQGEHALAHQRLHRVLDALLIAPVREARRQAARQPQRAIQVAQEQRPAVGTELPAIETRDYLPRTQGLKPKLSLLTVNLKRIGRQLLVILFHTK